MPPVRKVIPVGRGSYFTDPPEVIAWADRSAISVGNYSSLARGVRFILDAEHDPRRVTTSPRHGVDVPGSKGDIRVGSDVWVGAYATFLSGVTVGDGAVVGAGAVVAKDVPPYAVAVGNPARVVRHRFDPATVAALLAIRWWDWPDDRVAAAADLIWSDRVAEFVARYAPGAAPRVVAAGPPARPAREGAAAAETVAATPPPPQPPPPAATVVSVRPGHEPAPPSACVVLVPVGGAIDPGCDDALKELERQGYPVWRVRGYSAVDAARNQMATDALAQGYAELMWVDADVAFDPADVARLRAHNRPFTCGLYPKKGPRQFACEFLPSTPAVRFGRHGGLVEVRYCGFGFTHVRREVFEAVQRHHHLPTCNQRFGSPLVPYFEPTSVTDPGGRWSISEDYAFCERARQAGFAPVADTRVRLWHVGSYRYGWEDAGSSKERYADYTFHLPGAPPDARPVPAEPAPPAPVGYTEDWFTQHVPLWEKLLAPLRGKPVSALEVGVFEGRSAVWLLDHVLTHPDATLTWVDTFAGGADHAGLDLAGLEGRFRANTARFGGKISGTVGRSQDVLRGMTGERFDLAYIDASHLAADVLADAVLAWPLLKVGGLLGFDDYGWRADPAPERCPGLGIDAFLSAIRGHYREVHRGYQVWVQKTG